MIFTRQYNIRFSCYASLVEFNIKKTIMGNGSKAEVYYNHLKVYLLTLLQILNNCEGKVFRNGLFWVSTVIFLYLMLTGMCCKLLYLRSTYWMEHGKNLGRWFIELFFKFRCWIEHGSLLGNAFNWLSFRLRCSMESGRLSGRLLNRLFFMFIYLIDLGNLSGSLLILLFRSFRHWSEFGKLFGNLLSRLKPKFSCSIEVGKLSKELSNLLIS